MFKPGHRFWGAAFAAVATLFLASCGGGGDGGGDGSLSYRGQLVSSSPIGGLSLCTLHRIEFATVNMAGELVKASGLAGIPSDNTSPGMVSVQIGTIMSDADAPSNGVNTGEASAGCFIGVATFMADYLGFGASRDAVGIPPFGHTGVAARNAVDMVRAGKELMTSLGTVYDDRLFLAGYSIGGAVTMAMQREIETHHAGEFNLAAAIAGGGPYDMQATASFMVSLAALPVPSFPAFVVVGFSEAYGWGRPMTDFFNEPYAGKLPGLFNGLRDRVAIDAELTSVTADLFNPAFLAALAGGPGEEAFKGALSENSTYAGWTPKAPTRLFHGANETIIPYENATTALSHYKAAGAPDVTLTPCNEGDGNHGDCGAPFYTYARITIEGML